MGIPTKAHETPKNVPWAQIRLVSPTTATATSNNTLVPGDTLRGYIQVDNDKAATALGSTQIRRASKKFKRGKEEKQRLSFGLLFVGTESTTIVSSTETWSKQQEEELDENEDNSSAKEKDHCYKQQQRTLIKARVNANPFENHSFAIPIPKRLPASLCQDASVKRNKGSNVTIENQLQAFCHKVSNNTNVQSLCPVSIALESPSPTIQQQTLQHPTTRMEQVSFVMQAPSTNRQKPVENEDRSWCTWEWPWSQSSGNEQGRDNLYELLAKPKDLAQRLDRVLDVRVELPPDLLLQSPQDKSNNSMEANALDVFSFLPEYESWMDRVSKPTLHVSCEIRRMWQWKAQGLVYSEGETVTQQHQLYEPDNHNASPDKMTLKLPGPRQVPTLKESLVSVEYRLLCSVYQQVEQQQPTTADSTQHKILLASTSVPLRII